MSVEEDGAKSTVAFGDESEFDYLEQLRETIDGDWKKVENAQAFECDLGCDLCTVMVEKAGDHWIGKLSAVNPAVEVKTEPCAELRTAVLNLRVLIRDHGLKVKERALDLIEVAANAN